MAVDLKARLESAKARKAAAESAITDSLREEMATREEIAKVEAEERAAKKMLRDHSLAMREDAAREALGPDVKLCGVAIDGYEDTFILRHNAKAHAKWEAQVNETSKKSDRAEVSRNYAAECVYDWNGKVNLDMVSGPELAVFLRKHPGIVTPLVNAAARLAGFFAEDSKST